MNNALLSNGTKLLKGGNRCLFSVRQLSNQLGEEIQL